MTTISPNQTKGRMITNLRQDRHFAAREYLVAQQQSLLFSDLASSIDCWVESDSKNRDRSDTAVSLEDIVMADHNLEFLIDGEARNGLTDWSHRRYCSRDRTHEFDESTSATEKQKVSLLWIRREERRGTE